MLVVSPFSRGGYLSSDVFDHTSLIRFLETRFGIHSSEISQWRRRTVGDLTSTLRMSGARIAVPRLPATTNFRSLARSVEGCTDRDVSESATNFPNYPMSPSQAVPVQESGSLHLLQ